MQGLRSRAAIVVMTASAFALLSVPVIALGKGPPEAKSGETDTATGVASPEPNVPAPPPGQADKPPSAPKPAPNPAPPGQAKPRPAQKAPRGPAKRQAAAPAPVPGRGPDGSGPPGLTKKSGAPPYGQARGHSKHHPSSEPAQGSSDPGTPSGEPGLSVLPDTPSRSPSADEPDVTGGIDLPSADDVEGSGGGEADVADVAGAVVSDTAQLPEDASPETLPFTGLGLAFIALGGLAALAGGLMLRRTAAR